MDVKSGLTNKYEYSSSVENTTVRLLINESNVSNSNDSFRNVFHNHLYNEIFVCTSGEIDIQTNTEVILLKANEAAIIPANMPHFKISTKNFDNWFSIGFSVDKKHSGNQADLYSKLKPICESQSVTVFKNVPEVCKKIAEYQHLPPKSSDPLPALELTCILIKLAELKPKDNLPNSTSQMRIQDIYRFSWFEDILNNRFHEPLTISKMAQALNISPRQLSRLIKTRYGVTFHQLLIKRRLDSAVNLLTSTNLSVNSILSEVGYTKSSLFYKDFAAKFNMTPTEYRKKSSKTNT